MMPSIAGLGGAEYMRIAVKGGKLAGKLGMNQCATDGEMGPMSKYNGKFGGRS